MKRLLLFAVSIALLGCTAATVNTKSVAEIYEGTPIGRKYKFISHIQSEKKGCTFEESDKADILEDVRSKYGADAIVNVTYRYKTTFGHEVINLFTLGMAGCEYLIVEGDAIKWEEIN